MKLLLAALIIAGCSASRPAHVIPATTPMTGELDRGQAETPTGAASHLPRGSALPVTEPTPEALRSARPTMSREVPVRVRASATVRGLSGVPTWYCRAGRSRCTHGYPDGPGVDLYAAAGPAIRRAIPHWRGRVVRVCAATCLRVRLVDFCACAAPHFLDLYYDSWAALGRPHWATVSW